MSPPPHPPDAAPKRWRYQLTRRTRLGLAALALLGLVGSLATAFVLSRDEQPPPGATPVAAGPPNTIAAAAAAETRAGEPPPNHAGAGMIAVLLGLGERLANPVDAGPEADVDSRPVDGGADDDDRADEVDAGQGASSGR